MRSMLTIFSAFGLGVLRLLVTCWAEYVQPVGLVFLEAALTPPTLTSRSCSSSS
jgi:hypothetical protein